MDVDASITPRLRMSRHSSGVQYDRSSNLASEAGPSRLPDISQILDLDMKDMPLSDDQFSFNEQSTPKTTTTPTATRSDNPAAVLRALLSRLPAHPPSPTKSHTPSVQGSTEQERESDFDTVSESNVAPSIAQESLKHIFSNALRDPGNTPQNAHLQSSNSRLSPLPRAEHYRLHSPLSRTNSPAGSLRSRDDDYVDVVHERQRNWNSPRPIWHKPPPLPNSPKGRASPSFSHSASSLSPPPPPPPTNGRIRTNSFRISKHSNGHLHNHHSRTDVSRIPNPTTTKEQGQSSRSLSPSFNEQSSPTPNCSSSLQVINDIRRTDDPSLRHTSRSPSPPVSFSKERNGLPSTRVKTPASSRKQETPRNEDSVCDRDMESDGLRETDFSSQRESPKLGVTSSPDISEDGHSRSGTPLGNGDLPQENDIGSISFFPAQITATSSPLTPIRNKGLRSLKNEFKTPSPPKGLPDLPTPSSSDESENQSHRNIQSGSKWTATPKPPGGWWLDTPKPSREVTEQKQASPSDDATQSNSDTPLAADDGLSYLKTPARAEDTRGFQPSAKTPKPPGGWVSTPAPAPIPDQSMPVDSPLDIPEQNQGLLTPVASFSKGSKLESTTPAAPGAWLATPAVKKSILKVRFEPEVSTLTDKSESDKHPDPYFDSSISGVSGLDDGDDGLQRTEELSSKSPPSSRRQKSQKSPKIRVLDAFGREQPDLSNQGRVNSSPSALRVVDAMEHLIDEVEDTLAEASATPTVSRRELLSRIRNGLDDLVVGIDDLNKDDQSLSIDHDRVQQLTTISNRARGLRERLYSQADNSRSSLRASSTKASWFPANPKAYIFLIILQLSLIWLVYRISINRAQELWLNRYYDPFNPELHLYIFKSDPLMHVLHSEGTRTTAWSSLVGHIWDGWIYFNGNMQFGFWEAWDNRYDNAWTPT